MATVGAEMLQKEYSGKQDDLIADFISGRHDYRKSAVYEVLGESLYQECCRYRVESVMAKRQSVSKSENGGKELLNG